MDAELLDLIPLWGLFLAVCTFAGLALEAGYHFGRWRHQQVAEEKETPVGAMVAAILGLLAFLLAFTFGLAANRFDTRREAVLDEANAIGTTYLRARLLPEPQRTEILRLLREYVDVRVTGIQELRIPETVARSAELHEALWQQALEASRNPDSIAVMTSLFFQSLNDLIDLHGKRVQYGLRNRIPGSIWVVLFALALISMLAVGYQSGLSGTRRSPAMSGLVLAFAGVMFLIADLDRGSEGFLTVSQQALIDLQHAMEQGPPTSSATPPLNKQPTSIPHQD